MVLKIHISVMRSLMPMSSEYEVAHGIKHTSSILASFPSLVCSLLAVQITSKKHTRSGNEAINILY